MWEELSCVIERKQAEKTSDRLPKDKGRLREAYISGKRENWATTKMKRIFRVLVLNGQ